MTTEELLTLAYMNAPKATTVLTLDKLENHLTVLQEPIVIQPELLMIFTIVGLAMKVTSVTKDQFTHSLANKVMHAH